MDNHQKTLNEVIFDDCINYEEELLEDETFNELGLTIYFSQGLLLSSEGGEYYEG
jgi:hypothetical protein